MIQARVSRGARLTLVVIGVLLATAACGGDDAIESSDPDAWQPAALSVDPDAPLSPLLINSNLGVGTNRLAIALIDDEGAFVGELAASATLFELATEGEDDSVVGVREVLRTTLVPREITPSLDHVHDDGSVHAHDGNPTPIFVAEVGLSRAGWWGLEIQSADTDPVRLRFFALERTREPGVGDLAPATRQLTLADVDDITELDSSVPPDPRLHDRTVAEAIALGKPTVVAFATPAFCQTRFCGPVLGEAVRPMVDEFGDAVSVIHIEPFDLELARGGRLEPVPALAEWGLFTEPWVFVIDAEGRIAAKFEGIVEADEIRTVLRRLLG